jgi:2-oxoglutarate/2-oxoacid ferredoxin oxidoreductase subunit alpha
MNTDITVKIGGEAGQGIQTVGGLLASTCHEAGFFLMGINDFESRIRGGHSFFQLRISNQPVHAPCNRVNLLVGMDQRTVDLHKDQVTQDGLIIQNGEEKETRDEIHVIPIFELARKAGGAVTANTVAAGVILALLGAPFELFERIINRQFEHSGPEIIEKNLKAGRLGFEAVKGLKCDFSLNWDRKKAGGVLMTGSLAMALGALAGDCRFASFYPMSPATGIMEQLASYQDQFPLVVEQAEDEISAVNMIIGAAFAGVRSMTATSGGGFCLMTEGLGLAGITETPVVIVNGQRPGPATGLPTRTGQGDLHFMIRAAQDDFPRFVFAPGSPAEAFHTTLRALNLAEKYQTPAIILVDQFLLDSLFLVEEELSAPEKIERFLSPAGSTKDDNPYKRYALHDSGISPRALPGRSKALVVVSGNEHREDGHLSEDIDDRNAMVRKRASKLPGMLSEMRRPKSYHGDSKILLVGWGSSEGILRESVELLRNDDMDAGAVLFCDIWPFPVQHALEALSNADHLFVAEQNSTGQFAQLLRQETGLSASGKILKYDGRPFYPFEISSEVKQQLSKNRQKPRGPAKE